MRIGIDCRLVLEKPTGIGSYIIGLVRDLLRIDQENEYVLIVRDEPPDSLLNLSRGRARFARCPLPPMGPKQKALAQRYLRPLALDVYHYPHHDFPFGLEERTVVTVHHLPERGVSSGPSTVFNWFLLASIGLATRRVRRVIAVSRTTAENLVRRFDRREKVVNIYPPPSDLFDDIREEPLPAPLESRRYFLFVGQRRPHKNLERLLAAFSDPGLAGYQLAIVGPKYKDYDGPERAISQLGLEGRVYMPGAVSNPALRTLYRHALALVLPSLLEGFGYPLVEAFRFGIPVICSNRGSLPEIAGDAALIVEPCSVEQLRAAMRRIAADENLRQNLILRGKRRATAFSGTDNARKMLQLYTEIANAGRSR